MNENVTFAIKWGLVLGLMVFAAQKFLQVQAQKALPAPSNEQPDGNSWGFGIGGKNNDEPFCMIYPNDPLCNSFGGAGDAWI